MTPPELSSPGALAEGWTTATATGDRTTRTSGEPGVRLRCSLDLGQELGAVAGRPPSPYGRP
ncbi:DUF6207 family protein [Streptomyces sp. NPDC001544]|uniref:DUF6207 family protein n=1 Tax=Streptomyces sp. NPDC001544 TaxID=3364584 RepID=UPI0036766AED